MTNRVYISTTSTNSAQIYSNWVSVDGLESWDEVREEFSAGIYAALHQANEELGIADSELLVTDYEGELAGVFTGSHGTFDVEGFANAQAFAGTLTDDGEEAVAAYVNYFGEWNADHFEDAWQGKWGSEQEYAEQLIEDTGMLDGVAPMVARYFDYQAWTRDLFLDGTVYVDGNVFLSI